MLLVIRPVASLLLVVWPGAPSSVLAPSSKATENEEPLGPIVVSLLLVVRPGAPSSVLASVQTEEI